MRVAVGRGGDQGPDQLRGGVGSGGIYADKILCAVTTSAPAYIKGGMYFDLTLNKLRIGGATGWETVTSGSGY